MFPACLALVSESSRRAPQRPQALAPNLPRLPFVALVVLVPAVLDRDPQPAPAVPTSARTALDCPAAVLCEVSSAEPTPRYLLFSTSVYFPRRNPPWANPS